MLGWGYGIRRIALVLSLALLALPRLAHAHAALQSSIPAAAAAVKDSPSEITLTFNENVGPVFIRVMDSAGKDAGAPGEIKLDGNSLHLPLTAGLPNGTYVVSYRVVSADTHPVASTFAFSVGDAFAPLAKVGPAADTWIGAVAFDRFALYTAMLLAMGSALFSVSVTVPPAAKTATANLGSIAAAVALIAYVLSLGFGGAQLLTGGAEILRTPAPWIQGATTTLLPSAIAGVVGMVLLFVGFGNGRPGILLTGTIAALVSFLVTGHAATASPVWLMSTTVGIHLLCAAFWLGALRPLYVTTRTDTVGVAGAVMTEFSRRAVISVAALILSGIVITVVQVKTPAALMGTEYGVKLVVKIVFFVLLMAIAAYNKFILTPALENADEDAGRRLRRTITLEYIIYVLILGAAASLTLQPPPRALTESVGKAAADTSFNATLKADGYEAEVSVTPARSGQNMFMISVREDGAVVKLESVAALLALPAAGIADVEKKAEPAGDMWHIMVPEMIVPGTWDVKIEAFLNGFDKVEFESQVPIK